MSQRLHILVIPVLVVVALQAGGCSPKRIPPAAPGGTYLSNSAGASFEQSVNIAGQEGEYIAGFSLSGLDRPTFIAETLYVAAGNRGIVVSKDNGQSWTIVGTPLTNTADVVLLKDNTLVIAGTDAQGQGFILRSLDAGKSWQSVLTIPLPKPSSSFNLFGGDKTASVVLSLATDPFNQNRLYAGSNLGTIFIGEQSAKVWRTIQTLKPGQFEFTQTPESFGIRKIIPSPHTAGEFLVITNDQRLLRAKNTVQETISVPVIVGQPANLNTGNSRPVFDVTYIPGFPQALLVGVENGVVATRDGGKSWVDLNIPVDRAQKFSTIQVAVSPTNTNRLLIAINSVIYRSEDGGVSWNTHALGLPDFNITQLSIDPLNASHVLLVTNPANS